MPRVWIQLLLLCMAERRFSSLRDGAEEPPTGTHPEDEMTLEELREQIDVLDRQLVELLSERARAAQRIGHLKAATSLPVYEPGREKVIFANVRAANKGPLPDIELTHIYERIIDVMRSLQKNELASERNARAAAPGQAAGAGSSPETPETGKAQ